MRAERPSGGLRPLRRDASSAVELDDNLALYDEVGQFLILLNTSAATVWQLCDGATTVDEMAQALAAVHPDQAAEIEEDVRHTVAKLAELGLLIDVVGEPDTDADADADAVAEADAEADAKARLGEGRR